MKNIKLSVLALSFVAISASAADTKTVKVAKEVAKEVADVAKTGWFTAIKEAAAKGATAVKDAGVVTFKAAKAHPCYATLIGTAAVVATATVIYNRKAIASGLKTVCNKVCEVVSNNKKTTLAVTATLAAALLAWKTGKLATAANYVTSFFKKAAVTK